MTFSGWEEVATVVSQVVPATLVGLFVVLYIMLSFFTMFSLVTGIINISFVTAQRQDDDRRLSAIEEHRTYFATALTNVFLATEQRHRGFLNRTEFKSTLEAHPAVLSQ